MGISNHAQVNWCYLFLPLFMVITMRLQTPPRVSGFGLGRQIQANFGMYCTRRARQRFPIHADIIRCNGFCAPHNDVRNLFTIQVNATSYFSDNVQVSITADPRGGFSNNIRGFAVVAMTENETIVGRFSEQPNALIASCDPLMEGDTAFHARASINRRSLTLTWQPDSKNYGRVQFQAWIVVQHYTIYTLSSDYLDNEISGSRQYDILDNFNTFMLHVFNISRSAATILTNNQHDEDDDDDDNHHHHHKNNEKDDIDDDDDDTVHTNHHGDNNEEEESDTTSAPPRTVAVSTFGSDDSSGRDDGNMGNDVSDMSPSPFYFLSGAGKFGVGRNISFMRTNHAINALISRFTTVPPINYGDNSTHDNRSSSDNSGSHSISRSSSTSSDNSGSHSSSRSSSTSSNNSGSHSSSRSSGRSSDSRDSSSNSGNRSSSISSSSNDRGISSSSSSSSSRSNRRNSSDNSSNINISSVSSNSSISSNSSTIRVLVSMANGRNMVLTIPSLSSFEKAFERRLMTTSGDVDAEDPFHDLKQDIPTFTDLFPHPPPTTSSALSAPFAPSSGNPFFQAFGTSQSRSPSRSNGVVSPTTRIRQTFSSLLSTFSSQNDFRRQGLNTNRNQFGGFSGALSNQFNQLTNGGGGLGFPTGTEFFQRPNSNTRFTGAQLGLGTNSGSAFGSPTSTNAFQRLSGSGGFSGNGFGQQTNNGFLSSGNSFQSPSTNDAFINRNFGALLPRSQRNQFTRSFGTSTPSMLTTLGNTDFSGTGSRLGFPDTNSLFARFAPTSTANQIPQQFNLNGGFSSSFSSNGLGISGFNQQNPGGGLLQAPNLRNNFFGQQNSFARQPNFGSNVFAQQTQGNSFFEQRNNVWNNMPPQQFHASNGGQQGNRFGTGSLGFSSNRFGQSTNPFSLPTTIQNNMATFAGGRQSDINFFNRAGFQPQSGSTSQFAGSFPTSASSLLGGIRNQFNSFSNAAFTQTGNAINRGVAFNSFTPRSRQEQEFCPPFCN